MNDAEGASCRLLAVLAAVLAAVMFVFPLFVHFPLLDPDEGLHASIALEMVDSGNWITPRFVGQPFLDKPILYFWAQAVSLQLLGSSEWAVRLPGLLFGFLGSVTTGLLAWRLFGEKAGWIASILYTTTILPTALAQAAAHDVALIPWVNLALLVLWESQNALRVRPLLLHTVGAGLFIGLSILTKGLMGVAVVGLAYGSYVLLTRQLLIFARPRNRGRPTEGRKLGAIASFASPFAERISINARTIVVGVGVLLVGAAVAAPWYLAMNAQNAGFLRYYFIERHVLGVATGGQRHGDQPWWYYLPILLGGGLPWIGYLPVLVQDSVSKRREDGAKRGENGDRRALLLLWCWLLGWITFLTLAQSKLITYLWPIFPPMAILVAVAWLRLIEGSLSSPARRSFARTFVCSSWSGPIVVPAVAFVVQWVYNASFDGWLWLAIALVAVASPLPLIPWRRARWQASLGAAGLSLAAQFVVVIALVLPTLADRFSARDLAEHFNHLQRLPSRLLVAEERVGSFVFYLDPRLRRALKPGQLERLLAHQPKPLVDGDLVAMPEHRAFRVTKYASLRDCPYDVVGRYRLYRIEVAP